MTNTPEEIEAVGRLSRMMLKQMSNNRHKGTILDFDDFNAIVTDLEYHKAKFFIALRTHNLGAMKEYLADMGNYILAIGNHFGLLDDEPVVGAWEINNKTDIFVNVPIDRQGREKLIKKL